MREILEAQIRSIEANIGLVRSAIGDLTDGPDLEKARSRLAHLERELTELRSQLVALG